jgi:hypothetical protein
MKICFLNHFCHPLFICLAVSAPPNPTFAASAHTFATPLQNLTHASQSLALNPNAYVNMSSELLI